MIRLLKIELEKILFYKTFRLLMGIYLVGLILCFFLLQGLVFPFVTVITREIFQFPFIWQNLAFSGQYFNIILAFIVISTITNEYVNRTLKQNVIDGLSRMEIVISKFYLLLLVSVFVGVYFGLAGLILGLSYTPSDALSASNIWDKAGFLLSFIVFTMSLLSMAALFSFIIRKQGPALIIFLAYPLIELILRSRMDWAGEQFFPSKVIFSIIKTPNSTLLAEQNIGFDWQLSAFNQSFFMGLVYIAVFWFAIALLVKKRDL